MFLERKTYTVPNVVDISFIIAVSKFISADEMKEFVIVKDFPYSDVRNMLQEKNSDAKEISETSVRRSNFSEEEFPKIIFLYASNV